MRREVPVWVAVVVIVVVLVVIGAIYVWLERRKPIARQPMPPMGKTPVPGAVAPPAKEKPPQPPGQ